MRDETAWVPGLASAVDDMVAMYVCVCVCAKRRRFVLSMLLQSRWPVFVTPNMLGTLLLEG